MQRHQGQTSSHCTSNSDLARLLEQHREGQLDRPISEVMTKSPLTIDGDALLSQAVEMLSAKKISELPVVDDDGRPVGLIDITDVIALMPQTSSPNSERETGGSPVWPLR